MNRSASSSLASRARSRLDRPVRDDEARVWTAVTRVDDDPLADQRRPGRVERRGLAQQLWASTDDLASEAAQRAHGVRAARPVGNQAHLALEPCDGTRGASAVDAVGAADVITHFQQALLELPDVVAHHGVGDGVVERALAETP